MNCLNAVFIVRDSVAPEVMFPIQIPLQPHELSHWSQLKNPSGLRQRRGTKHLVKRWTNNTPDKALGFSLLLHIIIYLFF